ncbi:MAG TPA: hypothetical protein DHU26_01775 [Spirochaetaceae bacterium]|nr:hypothetical protein [Spirochaetaceae bacterium]HCX95722.1 hypothetical protein [Spirochaetaceae bacterium]
MRRLEQLLVQRGPAWYGSELREISESQVRGPVFAFSAQNCTKRPRKSILAAPNCKELPRPLQYAP